MGTASDARLGTELLGYRLDERVGRGGMGVVYRAYDPRLKRNVALKLLAPELADDARFRERFLAETELAAALEHPNVVPIHDAGELDDQLYLVMRYVEGSDLRKLLHDVGSLEPARAITICAQVADALDAAHERGLVHRDVKPSNVLLDRREHVYLADFGLSRRLSEQAPGFEIGLSLGTPAYVAPEEIEGRNVDGRTDQYSLACVLHECLMGRPPFPRASEAATLFAHLEEKPPSVPGLEEVLVRALAKQPSARYETCRDFVDAARSALGLGSAKRSRWSLAVAVAAVIVAGALAAVLVTRGESDARVAAGTLTQIGPDSGQVTGSFSMIQAPRAIAADGSTVWAADHATSRVERVGGTDGHVQFATVAHGTPTDIAVGGSRVVVGNGPLDGTVDILGRATGASEKLVSLGLDGASRAPVHVAVTSADGTIWIATGDRRIARLDPVRGRLVNPVTIAPPADERADASFSGLAAREEAVWVLGDPLQRKLWKIDPKTGELASTTSLPFAPTDLSADESAVWVTSQLDDTLARVDARTGRVTDVVAVGRGASAVTVGAGAVWVVNTVDGTVSRVDPETLTVETIDVEGTPTDIAIGDDVWVSGAVTPDPVDKAAITIGVLADCEGELGFFYEESLAGAQVALLRRGGTLIGAKPSDGVRGATVAGADVEVVHSCSDGTAPRALAEARRLVEIEGADILVGPSTVAEAFAIQAYARRRPGVAFVNGLSTGQALTLGPGAAPNVFRFGTDAAQWMAGIGDHAYNTLGWRRVVTLAQEHPFSYTQNAGFTAEFCSLGGSIAQTIWVPRGSSDVSSYVSSIPRRGVDGYVVLGQASVVIGFIDALPDFGGERLARHVVAGSSLFLTSEALGPRIAGVVAGVQDPGEGLSDEPAWLSYIADFDHFFPALRGSASSVWALSYFNAVDAVMRGLTAVKADLSDGGVRLQEALATTRLDAPQGHLRLDERNQAVGPNYLTPFKTNRAGKIEGYTMLRRVYGVEQTFNGYFEPGSPPPGKNVPCKRGNPPPWTRH